MLYGWMGTYLEIDLSRRNIEKEESDQRIAENYLGGKGTNAKLLWEKVPPETAPFSSDSVLIIGNGVLTGTTVPSANRAVLTYRSPQNGLHMHSAIGGFWPAEMKHAGYDTVVISGKSDNPVYLWINDDKVEIRDAGHLWGKSTYETKRIIREELRNNKIQVISIGLAGENKVYGATLEDGRGSSASRGGIGALMGDKKLKAIAVYGTKDIYIAKPDKLNKLCEYVLGRTGTLRDYIENFSSQMNMSNMTFSFVGNLNEPIGEAFPDSLGVLAEKCQSFIDGTRTREVACYNCGIRCKQVFRRPDGVSSIIKCQSWWAFMVSTKTIDYDFAIKCYNLCEEFGLDSVSVSRYIAFAIELYLKGILTKKDTDGMQLEWGNTEVILSIIEKIAKREGIGDVLANGVYEAARQIGKGAEEYAHHTKKLELIPASSIFNFPFFALVLSISDKADPTRNMGIYTMGDWILPREKREEYFKSEHCVYPKEYEKYVLSEFDWTGDNPEPGCRIAAYDEETFTITDMLGICNFWSIYFPGPPINSRALQADLISCATGMDIDEGELTRISRRVVNLVRAYNIRSGLRRKDDTIPKVFFKRLPTPQMPSNLNPNSLDRYIDRFYELRGWNKDGIPTKKELEELGLTYVVQEFERRSIF